MCEKASPKAKVVIVKDTSIGGNVEQTEREHIKDETKIPSFQPMLHYPTKMKKDQQDEQFKKLLELLKTLHINVITDKIINLALMLLLSKKYILH